jgi:GT2 family glycosyltransferase
MERETGYGILSPQIDAPIGPESPSGIWYVGGKADLAKVTTIHQTALDDSPTGILPTGYVTGCAMFLRCQALSQAGLFWAPLFLYWEDVDLSLRMAAAGWRLGVLPAARIVHFVHGSVQSGVVRYYYYRNAVLVAHRHLGPWGATQAFLSLAYRALRRWAASALKGDGPLPVPETRGLVRAAAIVTGLRRLQTPE